MQVLHVAALTLNRKNAMTTRVVTGKCRFVYCSVMSARKNEMNGKDEFSTQVLVPKSDTETVVALKAAAKEALMAKFGDKIPKNVRNPLRDGDTEVKSDGSPLGPEYAGHYFFNTKSTNKPGAVDAHGHDILGSQDIVSGDYGRVSLNAYAYDQAGKIGGEIAGTAGAGGVLGKAVEVTGRAPMLAQALRP